MIKLDSLAVLAKPAKIRVKINCHSPSIEKKGAKSVSTITYGKMAGLAEMAGRCPSLSS